VKKALILILGIPILFNFGEILYYKLPNNLTNVNFIVVYSITLFTVIFNSFPNHLVHKEINRKFRNLLLLFGVLCFIPFLIFIFINVDFSSLIKLGLFMEKYRNGGFKGSGFYTFLSTNIFPFVYCFFLMVYKFKIKDHILFLFLIITPPFLLGLRVWLIPVFFSYAIVFFSRKNIKLKELFIFIAFILTIILSTKLILAPDTYGDNFSTTLFRVLSRTNYQAVFIPKLDINLLSTLLDSFSYLEAKDYFYFKNQFHIESLYFNRISLTSGLALPLPVFILNIFGNYIGLVFLIVIFYVLCKCFKASLNKNYSIYVRAIFYYIFIIVLSSIIEDSHFLTKLILIPILVVIIGVFKKINRLTIKKY
jgi:hypothetical protein